MASLLITFVSESAGYLNSFGWYNKRTGEAGIVFRNTNDDGSHAAITAGATATVNVDQIDIDSGNFGFFLIANGASIYGTGASSVLNGPLSFSIKGNGDGVIRDASGHKLTGEQGELIFTDKALNRNNVDYTTDGSGRTAAAINADQADGITGRIAFEDLVKHSDRDFNDLVVDVRIVDSGNRPPVVNDQAFSIAENSSAGALVGQVAASDPDAGQALSYAIVGDNANGAFAIDAATGAITVADPSKLDFENPLLNLYALTVRVTDNGTGALTDTATVSISIANVNEAPVAANDTVAGGAVEDVALVIPAANLLVNDTDLDNGGSHSIVSVGGAVNGAVALNGNGDVVFTPAAGYSGPASFTYTLSDGALTSTATVALDVTADADAPTLLLSDASSTGNGATGLSVLAALGDLDGSESLGIQISGVPDGWTLSAGVVDPDTGIYLLTAADLAGLAITPPADTVGSISLTVTATATEASNGDTASVSGSLTVSVTQLGVLQGQAIEGYIAGATVFADADRDGELDAGEARATTDANGNFALVGGTGPLVLFGGTDVSTGQALDGVLRAPEGATVVTPLTTLIAALVEQGQSVAAATANVSASFGLDGLTVGGSPIDLLSFDPVEIAAAGGADGDAAAQVLAAGIQVQIAIVQVSALLEGAGATDAGHAVVAELASLMSAGTPVDLTSAATAEALINDAATTATGVDPVDVAAVAADAALVVSAANGEVDQALAGGSGVAVLEDLAQVAAVAQSDTVVSDLSAAGSANDPGTIATDYTGSNLETQIDSAPVGDVNGGAVGTLGNDALTGSPGNDAIDGLAGNDELDGLGGNDQLFGSEGRDTLRGSAGDDLLDGGAGADRMLGGRGDDSYVVDDAGDVVDEGVVAPRLVSVGALGEQGNGNSNFAQITPDARYAVFQTQATNWAGTDSNLVLDVYVKDLQTGALTLVSADQSGAAGGGTNPQITPDGQTVVFQSANALLEGDGNGVNDIYAKDLGTGMLTRVSTSGSGAHGNLDSTHGDITPDGRYVAFQSQASNLVSGDINGARDIFVKTLAGGEVRLVSTDASGNQANGASGTDATPGGPQITPDGRYVVFQSLASNLVSGDTNGVGDIFVKDVQTGAVTRASTDSAGTQADAVSERAQITPDGRYVVFQSMASNLVAGDTNANLDVFVKDLLDGSIERVSVGPQGAQGGSSPQITPDGHYVVFQSGVPPLLPGDLNPAGTDIYVKDLESGQLGLVPVLWPGMPPVFNSSVAQITDDGHFIAFQSNATTLVAGDANNATDVFLVENPLWGGTDKVVSSIDYVLPAGVENLELTGAAISGMGNALDNVITGNAQNNTLEGGVGADTLNGGAGDDLLIGGTGVNFINGGEGDDVLVGSMSAGYSVMVGGAGIDTASYATAPASVTVDLSVSTNQVTIGGFFTLESLAQIENLTGSAFADSLKGDDGVNVLDGGAGDDTLTGGAGADRMLGGRGDDSYVVDDAGDVVDEGVVAPRLVSVGALGEQGNGNSNFAQITPDARYAVFQTQATNWAGTDSNLVLDVYVKDLQTGALTLVSADQSGAAGGGTNPQITPDGQTVVFQSANALLEGDGNGVNDIYAKDLGTGMLTRVSTSGSGAHGNLDSTHGDITPDGRYVAFQSQASNLVSGDINGARDIFVKTLAGGEVRLVSTDASGNQANGASGTDATPGGPQITPDGRYVVFQSLASNLVSGDTNGVGDIFVKDVQTGAVTRASTDSAGTQADAVSERAQITPDGRYVVFQSMASNLVAGDTNANLDVFVKDLLDGSIERVSVGPQGAQGGSSPQITPDGHYVVFQSGVPPLLPGDLNPAGTDIYVKDLESGQLGLVPVLWPGMPPVFNSSVAQITDDGHFIAFQSNATTLVAGDANNATDVFLVENPLWGGTDKVVSSIDYVLPAGVENLELTGAAISGMGNALDNVITGNAQNNTLEGGVGADTLNGGAGDDLLIGGTGVNFINGGEGDDVLVGSMSAGYSVMVGGAGIDTASYATAPASVTVDLSVSTNQVTIGGFFTLESLAQIENLTGSAFADSLKGDDGVNVLDGGAGDDTLTGGAGADRFVFDSLYTSPGTGDQITDFAAGPGGDVLDIADLLDTSTNYAEGDGGALAEYVQVVASGADALLQIDADGSAGGAAWQTLATLLGAGGLDLSTLLLSGNIDYA